MRDLELEMKPDALLELTPHSIGEFADRAINAEVLLEELEYGPFGPLRKDFCEFLGIGESTLTGWLKEDRIPRASKLAYALVVGMTVLQDEVRRLRSEAKDLKLLKDGEKYLVVRFETDDTGVAIGTVVARDIADAKTARVLAASYRAFSLLHEIWASERHGWETNWESSANPWFRDIQTRVLKEIVSAFDPDSWQPIFRTLDSMDPNMVAAIGEQAAIHAADDSEPAPKERAVEASAATRGASSQDAVYRKGE